MIRNIDNIVKSIHGQLNVSWDPGKAGNRAQRYTAILAL